MRIVDDIQIDGVVGNLQKDRDLSASKEEQISELETKKSLVSIVDIDTLEKSKNANISSENIKIINENLMMLQEARFSLKQMDEDDIENDTMKKIESIIENTNKEIILTTKESDSEQQKNSNLTAVAEEVGKTILDLKEGILKINDSESNMSVEIITKKLDENLEDIAKTIKETLPSQQMRTPNEFQKSNFNDLVGQLTASMNPQAIFQDRISAILK